MNKKDQFRFIVENEDVHYLNIIENEIIAKIVPLPTIEYTQYSSYREVLVMFELPQNRIDFLEMMRDKKIHFRLSA